jgi:hypothetical protein
VCSATHVYFLVVGSQSRASGRLLAGGTRVALVLVEKPKPVKRRR